MKGKARVWLERRSNKLMGCSYGPLDRIKKHQYYLYEHCRLLSSELAHTASCKLDHKDRIHKCIQNTHQLPAIAQGYWHGYVHP